ncbi:MAG: SRPBCC family protein [Chitinophagaceae bacterium]|nr:SRPBCC family protein [Chitinophagaceae bacterium]
MIAVYIFIGLVVIILLISFLMPKTYNVERSIVIKRPAEEVKRYVGDFNYYAAWNPWQKMEPASVKTISGMPHSPGHKYEWKGKKIGVGSLTMKNMDDKHIHIDLEFLKPWKAKAKDNWLFESWGDGSETKVTWQNSGELPWPIARLMGPMISKNLNHQFGTGLENLKNMCEGG